MGEFSPVNRNYQYQYCKFLDVSLMRKASMCLIGKHDFRAFCTDSKDKENCVRTIYSIDFDILGDILKITFEGDGFLRKMIRNIVGSLIEVGSLKKDVSYVSDILESNFYKYFKQFGLLQKTNVDLPGEAATIMHNPKNMGLVELATVAFGQSFQITPIQMATTASSIVNGDRKSVV